MAHTDDQWVRLFNVSDPRRAYAGHTLYKVTSKVIVMNRCCVIYKVKHPAREANKLELLDATIQLH